MIEQKVIYDSQEIFNKLKVELLSAKEEIIVATAWFTDKDLYDVILKKVDEGVKVDIIIADNQENGKLDFDFFV